MTHTRIATPRLVPIALLSIGACGGFAPALAGQTGASRLTPSERNGKRIYTRGESRSGDDITAFVGEPPMGVSAKMLPCINCHGADGAGKPEGGLVPTNLKWSVLIRSYGTTGPSPRRHRPYDEDTLKRAITHHIDPSGNTLGVGMPKFAMTDHDLDDLVAYLKRIEHDRDPGVTDGHITLATLLPVDGPRADLGIAVRDVLDALFADVDAEGGVYKRNIRLRVVPAGNTPDESITRLNHVLDADGAFAIVAPYAPGAEAALAALAAEREIPIVAPLTGAPDRIDGDNTFVFHLAAGLAVQARALVDHWASVATRPDAANAALIERHGPPFASTADAIARQCRTQNIPLRRVAPYRPDAFSPETLANAIGGADALFFVGPADDCVDVLRELADAQRLPRVYLLSAFLGNNIFDAPARFRDTIVAAFPNSRSAQSPRGVEAYRAFLDRHGLASKASAVRVTAYCAGTLLIEALRGAGVDVRRELLIRELEGLYEHDTGLMPPITFGPNRRVGAYGAYIVTVDLARRAFVCNNRWIEPVDPAGRADQWIEPED